MAPRSGAELERDRVGAEVNLHVPIAIASRCRFVVRPSVEQPAVGEFS